VFIACVVMHRGWCRPAASTPQAANTVYCSWGWAKLSPETCWANWNY